MMTSANCILCNTILYYLIYVHRLSSLMKYVCNSKINHMNVPKIVIVIVYIINHKAFECVHGM